MKLKIFDVNTLHVWRGRNNGGCALSFEYWKEPLVTTEEENRDQSLKTSMYRNDGFLHTINLEEGFLAMI